MKTKRYKHCKRTMNLVVAMLVAFSTVLSGCASTNSDSVITQAGESVSLVGADGKSAYEVAVENGYEGTELEWLASLVGEAGKNGDNGKSAYELAVETGYKGTEAQWRASLVGATGAAGRDGKDGSTGCSYQTS